MTVVNTALASDLQPEAGPASPALALHGVRLRRQQRQVLAGIDVQLPVRGAVALVGPNGAGKSSLLSVLAGLSAPDAGQVLLHGRPMAAMPVAERARHIGYMPQQFTPHWDLTVQELVQVRLALRPELGKSPAQLLHAQGLGAFALRRWSSLSGGEQARVLLATVLAVQPPILLADEPGAALDVRHRLELVHALAQRGRAQLVVVVMHDLELAFQCFERILVMAQGRIVLDGGPELALDERLDAHFGVRFERIGTPPQVLLRAQWPLS